MCESFPLNVLLRVLNQIFYGLQELALMKRPWQFIAGEKLSRKQEVTELVQCPTLNIPKLLGTPDPSSGLPAVPRVGLWCPAQILSLCRGAGARGYGKLELEPVGLQEWS